MKKFCIFLGLFAPVWYVITVIIGGILWPGYNHITQAVSELTGSYAPNKLIMDIFFFIYNVSLLIFGFTTAHNLRDVKYKKFRISLTLIGISGIIGIIWFFFPMDTVGTETTLLGTIHIILAAITAPLTIILVFLTWLNSRKETFLTTIRLYLLLTFILMMIFGPLAGISAASFPQLTGLFERIIIGLFLQYLFVIALKLCKNLEIF